MPGAVSPQRPGTSPRRRSLRVHADVEIRLVVIIIPGLQSNADTAARSYLDEGRDIEVMRPASNLTRDERRSGQGVEQCRGVAEPFGELLEACGFARIE